MLLGTVETWSHFDVREIGPFGLLLDVSRPVPSGTRLRGRLSGFGRRQAIEVEIRNSRPLIPNDHSARYGAGVAFPEGTGGPVLELLANPPPGRLLAPTRANDRRRGWRTACAGEAHFEVHATTNVELRDLSMGGAMFTSPAELQPTMKGSLRTRLGEHSVFGEIEIRRLSSEIKSDRLVHQIAASFVSLDDENRRSLASLLTAARK